MTQALHGSGPPEMAVLVSRSGLYPSTNIRGHLEGDGGTKGGVLPKSFCFQGPDLLNE